METQRNLRNAPGARKIGLAKLLLVDRDSEFEGNVTRRIFGGDRLWSTIRSESLLGALERLHSDKINLVLLAQEFRDDELALFISDARRDGFEGLILRVASTRISGSDFSGYASASSRPAARPLPEDPTLLRAWPAQQPGPTQQRGPEHAISLGARQRAVLARVSEGWSNQQVARHLKCTEGAVKAALQELFKKLGVRKRAQIVRMVLERNLIGPGEGTASPAYRARELDPPSAPPAVLESKTPIHIGDFVIDIAMHRVLVRGVEIHLTPREFELLAVFAMHPGELVRSSSLREMFWRNPTARQEVLRVLIGGLRAKIEVSKLPRYVVTERNLGYRFIPSPFRSEPAQKDASERKPAAHRTGQAPRTRKGRGGGAARLVPARAPHSSPGTGGRWAKKATAEQVR